MTSTLHTKRLTPTVGAEVLDVDIDRLRNDDTLPVAVMDALDANGVLVFRGLNIDDETQISFCRKLGEIRLFPDQRIPEIFVVTLNPNENPSAKHLKATVYWHFDDNFQPTPTKATMLSGKVLSAEGGETEFASTYAVYDGLSEGEKERYAELRVLHSQVPVQSKVYQNPTPEQIAQWKTLSHEHPLVWTHRTGRRSLVLGETAESIVGMDNDEGRALLEDLNARATAPDRVYRHIWSAGDTVLWDNRGVLHRVLPYDPSSHRLMHRTTLLGDEAIQ